MSGYVARSLGRSARLRWDIIIFSGQGKDRSKKEPSTPMPIGKARGGPGWIQRSPRPEHTRRRLPKKATLSMQFIDINPLFITMARCPKKQHCPKEQKTLPKRRQTLPKKAKNVAKNGTLKRQ
jgi:hypothetical protein